MHACCFGCGDEGLLQRYAAGTDDADYCVLVFQGGGEVEEGVGYADYGDVIRVQGCGSLSGYYCDGVACLY